MAEKLAWDEIVQELQAPIYRYCMHLLRSSADAEDATQDSFLKAYRAENQPPNLPEMRLWLFTIARNVCLDRLRWWKRSPLSFLNSDSTPTSGGFEQPGHQSDLKFILQRVLAELPKRQYEVFVLRHWHGFSTEETATLLGIDSGSVKSHLKRSIDRLRRELSALGISDNDFASASV